MVQANTMCQTWCRLRRWADTGLSLNQALEDKMKKEIQFVLWLRKTCRGWTEVSGGKDTKQEATEIIQMGNPRGPSIQRKRRQTQEVLRQQNWQDQLEVLAARGKSLGWLWCLARVARQTEAPLTQARLTAEAPGEENRWGNSACVATGRVCKRAQGWSAAETLLKACRCEPSRPRCWWS